MNRKLQKRRTSLRRAMMAAVTEADVYEIMKLQVFLARKGDPVAVREVLDRTVGRAGDAEILDDGASSIAPAMFDEALCQAEHDEMLNSVPLCLESPKPHSERHSEPISEPQAG